MVSWPPGFVLIATLVVLSATTFTPPARAQDPAAPPEDTSGAAGSEGGPAVISISRKSLGTRVQMLLVPPTGEEERSRKAAEAAFTEMTRIEALLSEWNPDSDVSKINRAAGAPAPIAISPEAFEIVHTGKKVAALTSGAYAMTWAPLGRFWDFKQARAEVKKVPPQGKVREVLGLIDDQALELDVKASTARLPNPGMALSTDRLLHGAAIRRALRVLNDAGVQNALVFVGGDLGATGTKKGDPWLVGIQDPRGDGYFATLPIRNEALAVCGDYERSFTEGTTRYHDVLDPKTGFPARAVRSVAVVGPDPVFAEALSCGVFVLGPERGLSTLEGLADYQGIIVDANNAVSITSGLKNRVRILRPPSP